MRLDPFLSLSDLSDLIGGEIISPTESKIEGINEIHVAGKGDLVFVDHPKYVEATFNSTASAVITNIRPGKNHHKGVIFHTDPFEAFNRLLRHFRPKELVEFGIHPSVIIGENCQISSGASIGRNVVIGKNCWIDSGVIIGPHISIGDEVWIHSGSNIGGAGFYYQKRPDSIKTFHSAGEVHLHNGVHIGSGTCIDRGVTGDTIIGSDTKIDNLVQIGHDTKIGKRCIIAAQVGIAGATTIGNDVTIWGQAGINSGIVIEDNCIIAAQSGVTKSLKSGHTYLGTPAMPIRQAQKEMITLRNLAKKLG